MAMLVRYVAPAGAPIVAGDLLAWTRRLAAGSGQSALQEALRARFGDRAYFPTSTGRAGLTVLLRAMRRLASAERDEVVLPAYTCYSVAASVIKAGLTVRLVDVDPGTLDYAAEALAAADFRRVLAIVATSLYGRPSDMPSLVALGRDHGAFVVDDAAQAMGATIDGRAAGTWGDAGLFSFDKGKNVSAIDGGVVLTASDALTAALRAETATLPPPGLAASLVHTAKVLAYAAMLPPMAYGIATRLPGLGLGQTVFTTEYPLGAFDPRLAALAATMLPRLEGFAEARRANAAALTDALAGIPGVSTVAPRPGTVAACLRFPILCDSAAAKQRAIAALNDAGIGASGSYPAALADVPEVQRSMRGAPGPFEGGREVARRLVTLPTHPFVTTADITRMRDVLVAVPARPERAPEGTASARRLRENH